MTPSPARFNMQQRLRDAEKDARGSVGGFTVRESFRFADECPIEGCDMHLPCSDHPGMGQVCANCGTKNTDPYADYMNEDGIMACRHECYIALRKAAQS